MRSEANYRLLYTEMLSDGHLGTALRKLGSDSNLGGRLTVNKGNRLQDELA